MTTWECRHCLRACEIPNVERQPRCFKLKTQPRKVSELLQSHCLLNSLACGAENANLSLLPIKAKIMFSFQRMQSPTDAVMQQGEDLREKKRQVDLLTVPRLATRKNIHPFFALFFPPRQKKTSSRIDFKSRCLGKAKSHKRISKVQPDALSMTSMTRTWESDLVVCKCVLFKFLIT